MDRRTERTLLLLLLVSFILLLSRWRSGRGASSTPQYPTSRNALFTYRDVRHKPVTLRSLEPANSTLGFGAIAAVAKADSRRLPGLLLAGNITEIDITIPAQPKWTDADLDRLYAEEDSWLSRGSALAWLGHLNALRWFLSTDFETFLVFEDDVDWDIHLRTVQIPTAAAAIRRLTSAKSENPSHLSVDYNPRQNNYWGNTSEWDLLYLGHCGDIFKPHHWTDKIARVVYPDETLPASPHLHPYSAKFLQSINIPSGNRMIHDSIFPLCTFGFALTRHAAYRLLHEIASREPNGGKMAYDVRVLEACRDYGLRCFSANPELFHHIESESLISVVNNNENGGGGGGEAAAADDAGRLKPVRGGQTNNIACPIRSKYFFTEDPETLEFLREEVGRKGQCLKDVMEEDLGRVADLEPDVLSLTEYDTDPRLDNSG